MAWENNFFFLLILNAVTGNIMFLVNKLLLRIAQRYGCMRLMYNLQKGVVILFIVPFSYLFVKISNRTLRTGYYTGYDGNAVITMVFQLMFIAWLAGAIIVAVRYLKRYKGILRIRANNIPYENPLVESIFYGYYPKLRTSRVPVCQNFLVESPCVVGVFRPVLVLPEQEYSMLELKVILAHEATHIIHRDNLWKTVSLAIVIANWWNPVIYLFIKDWEEWSESYCDITVCRKFLEEDWKLYVAVLLKNAALDKIPFPTEFSFFKGKQSVTRRISRLSSMKTCKHRTALAVLLSAIFVVGSGLTAYAAGTATSDVGVTSYWNTLEAETSDEVIEINLDVVDNVTVFEMTAEEFAASEYEVVTMGDEDVSTYATQVYFDWDIAGETFGVSPNFLKRKDKEIKACAYISSTSGTSSVRFGVIRPNGSYVYSVAPMNDSTSIKYTTESLGWHKVAVQNIRTFSINASGYYVR